MKAIYLVLSSALVLFGFTFLNQSSEYIAGNQETGIRKLNLHCPEYSPVINAENKKADSKDIDQSWYQKAIENIEKDEYNITYSDELGAYQSPNRANNIRFIYGENGFTAKNRTDKIPLFDVSDKTIEEKDKKYEEIDEWNIKFQISDYDLQKSEFVAAGNKAHIENENIRIDYTNNKDGMRQDFIVKNKPACPLGEGEGKLRLNLSADTKLKMIVGADALMFKDKDGIDKMKYSSLKCWDANGKELRAYFESNSKLGIKNYELGIGKNKIPNSKFPIPNSFRIVVNDEDAIYPITIDPLSTSPDWTEVSGQASANFGFCVGTAGDVNGDGYSDIFVGAVVYDNGQTDEGRVFVYHGSATGPSATFDWRGESDQASAFFGGSAATAGDVNGDGYSDIIIGSIGYDSGGKVFAWYGSASGLGANGIPSNEDWSLGSVQANADLGFSVACAGDVNGDGYSDVIIGAQKYDNGQTDEGRAYLFLGSATGLNTALTWRAESNQAGARFGYCVSSAGDINGDGMSDVIIGARYYDNGQTDEGSAFVWFGTSGGLGANGTPSNAVWSAESNLASADFGYFVAPAGDVDGDGYSDVIVGAPLYDSTQTDAGRVYVYEGSPTGPSASPDMVLNGNQANGRFGCSLSPGGDINADGYADIIIGAYLYNNGQTDEGRAYVYFGSASGIQSTAGWTQEVDQAGAYFGFSVATAGDVNGDGYSDVVVGAYQYDGSGGAFLYLGSPDGLSTTSNWTAESNQAFADFGNSVSTAGDVNGDGYGDVIIGAPSYDNGQSNEGRALVYYGTPSGLLPSANWGAESNQANADFGTSVSTAGDVNGDGYGDVIVGAIDYDNGETDEGAAFVYYGSASGLSATANWTAESNQVNAGFGTSVSTAGDVNGDGYGDVIVGAPSYANGQSDEGRAFVYYGSASGLSTTSNWTAESNQASASFGGSVSTAGDVNGDGESDVIVGAPLYDNGQIDEGAAFIYYGSASGLSAIANWTAESNQAGSFYGRSVSTAGDVNGDGESDVIVGAPYYDNGQADEGRAFVYYGSESALSTTANRTAESNQLNANFGYSVSTAGDVNGDGYSDVIFGAPYYDNGQSSEGSAFVYYGSGLGLSTTTNWTAESDQANANFGYSVSTAGDVNGDGYSDVIVGAPSYDNGQSDEGTAFVYYGNSGTGLRSTVQQYKPGTSNIVYSGGYTGTNNQIRLNIFGKSPYGRADGNIVYEYKANSNPFSGATITNSVSSSGSGNNTDLSFIGVQLNDDVSGLLNNKEYKWRARVQYKLVNNPYQKLGPWKYYTNFVSLPFGCFKAIIIDNTPPAISYTNLADTSSLSNRTLSNVLITDANGVQGTSGTRPRIYYKRNSQKDTLIGNTSTTTGWKYVEASGSTSPFSFTINYSLLNGSKAFGDTIQYFVVAQDTRSFGPAKVGINNGTFSASPTSVNLTATAFPIGGTIKSYKITDDASPVISYTNLSDSAGTSGRSLSNVVINDSSGVQGASGTRPRVYYKKKSNTNAFNDNTNSTNGWKYAEASGSNSPFGFTLNYSLVNGGVTEVDTIQYFIVAQDVLSPVNVAIKSGTFAAAPASVALTGAAFPIGGTINSYKIIDNVVPNISYTNLTDTASLSNRNLSNVVITDLSGVQGASGTRPRVYYKKKSNSNTFNNNTNSTNGWKYAEASGSTSPFNFTLDYSLVNEGVTEVDTIQYFIVAQDNYNPANVAINSGTFAAAPSTVNLTSAAFPVAGTINSYAILSPPAMDLFLTVAMQGFYNAAFNSLVQDTVTVYLRNAGSPYSIVDTAKAFINGTGKSGIINTQYTFTNAVNGTPYYIQVTHRNSITTWSAGTQTFASNELYYDFSDAATQAFGDNMIQVDNSPVVFAIYGGDVNQDETVDATDVSTIDNDAANFVSGYVVTDLTGDNFVDGSDFSIADNNAANFVSVVRP